MIKLPYGYQTDIKRIKAAGFTHFKVELEADLSRDDDFDDEDYCRRFILSTLREETRRVLNFSRFYNDGSVDSEFTFTLPIEHAWRTVEIIEAFNDLADANGHGMTTDRAGMHLSLLTSGTYPTSRTLNATKLANFTTQVTKLLPALYAASSHDGLTRSMGYRRPQISPEKDSVYPAICTHDGTCLEYRLFDTCYDQPEAVLEKIQVISATLVYFDTRKKVSVEAKQFTLDRVCGDRENKQPFAKTIRDTDNLAALRETIKFVKPRGTSVKSFLAARGLNLNAKEMVRFSRAIDLRLSLAYQGYADSHTSRVHIELSKWLKACHPEIGGVEEIQAVLPAFNRWFQQNVNSTGTKPETFTQWVAHQSRPRLYENVLKEFDLTEPIAPPRPRQVSYTVAGANATGSFDITELNGFNF
jgi:hypothetical protein